MAREDPVPSKPWFNNIENNTTRTIQISLRSKESKEKALSLVEASDIQRKKVAIKKRTQAKRRRLAVLEAIIT